jgi:glutamyl aminopeptidase
MDHPECMQKIGEMFKDWLNADPVNQRPHPDLRFLIYFYGMRNAGTEKEWNLMFEIFSNELDASEKAKLQSGLCAIQDPVILNRFIELASANETYVRKQDYFSFMASVSGNRAGEMLIWDYVRQNWPSLVDRFGLSERNLGRMIPTVTSRFASEIRLQEMEDFFRKYPEAGAGANARRQALENIQNNIKWLKNNKNSVGQFLQNLK